MNEISWPILSLMFSVCDSTGGAIILLLFVQSLPLKCRISYALFACRKFCQK